MVERIIKFESFSCAPQNSIYSMVTKNLRRFIFLTCMAGSGMFLTGCMGGYVASEPAYVQYDRPVRPSESHIWIDGDWGWNRQTHVYVQKAGYWDKPRQGQKYVAGHWNSTNKGKSWSNGGWQKDSQKSNNRGNNNNDNSRR